MQNWNPIPQDLVAGLNKVTWSPACPAPELVAYAWTFQQLNLGDVVSVRDVAAYAGWGKTKAQRLLARAREDWAGWNPEKEVPQHESCRPRKGSGQRQDTGRTPAGQAQDTGGTAAGQVESDGAGVVEPPRDTDGTAAGQAQDADGTAAGPARDDRAPDLLGTPTRTLEITPPTPPAGGTGVESQEEFEAELPSWARRVAGLPERLDRARLASTVLDCIEAVTGTRPTPEQTDGQAQVVMLFWEKGRGKTADLHGMLRDVALVALWARLGGHPEAGELRRTGGHLTVKGVCSWFHWAARITPARQWAEQYGWQWDGRAWRQGSDQPDPDSTPPDPPTHPSGVPWSWAEQVMAESEAMRPEGISRDEWSVMCNVEAWCSSSLSGVDLEADTRLVVEAVTRRLRAGAA